MKKKSLIIIIILSVLLIGCSIENKTKKIERYIDDGNYSKAEDKVVKLMENNKENRELYDLYLSIYKKQGKNVEELLIKGIKMFDDSGYKRELADIYIHEEKLEEALGLLEDILVEEKTIDNYREIFEIYSKLEDNKKAIRLFERDAKYIDDEIIILKTALIYIEEKHEYKARNLVENIEESKIDDIKGLELLAEYYFRINDDENSYRIVRKGLKEYEEETILYGFNYGFMNSDGLKMIDIYSEDIDGDGKNENIILLSNKKETSDSNNIILTIQDGSNGDILGKKRLSSYTGYEKIIFKDFDGDRIKDMYIDIKVKKDVFEKPEIYTFINNNFKSLTDDYSYNDIEYRLVNDFKLEVYSENKNKKYVIDLIKEKDKLRNLDLFYEDGKIKNEDMAYLTDRTYEHIYIDILEKYGVKETYELKANEKILANIEVVYAYDNSIMTIYGFDVSSESHVKLQKYNGEKVNRVENIKLEEIKEILNMSKKNIYGKYGKPNKIDFLEKERLDYNGIQFFMEDSNNIDYIRILDINDIMEIKIPASYLDIINKLGRPDKELSGEEFVDEDELIYIDNGIEFRFSGRRENEENFILYIRKVNK